MEVFDWAAFLRKWNKEMLASPMAKDLPESVREAGWLGFPQATEPQIAEAERRLGIALPPSYKAFLLVSNGWHKTGHAIDRVWPIDQADWFRVTDPDWVASFSAPSSYVEREPVPDDEYFAYDQWVEDFRTEHLAETLQISEVGDAAVYLLNPQVITHEGEWEAWFLANWLPGVHRYRSFQELMQSQYASFAATEWKQPVGIIGNLPSEYVGSPGSSDRRIKPRHLSSDGPGVTELLAALNDPELAVRMFPKSKNIGRAGRMSRIMPQNEARRRVIDELGRRGDRSAVGPLISVLSSEEDRLVLKSAVDALGRLGGPEVVEAIFPVLNEGGNVATHAMRVLKELAPDRIADRLLDEVERASIMTLPAAARLMAELNDRRALPVLARILVEEASSPHFAHLAAVSIAEFGLSGLETLKSLLSNSEPKVRQLAATAILNIRRPEARDVLEPLVEDADPEIRNIAAVGMEVLPTRMN
ncbi:MAG TPA: HEAT repeat domain-containing protein [Tepidisphaeraceae bacterium]|jgi:HEAT repeat protein